VNLSARNLLEEDLPLNLKRLLQTSGVPPEQLTLEITESVIMEDPERALRVVTRLRDLGVGISVDDFGTGYSSLGYLMRLPAEELKIDKSFVMQMEQDAGSATIVHSTIDLAHNLGLKVVAEGVESDAIWRVLKELGCDFGQGYHFSRPLPADQLLSLLCASQARAAAAVAREPDPEAADLDGLHAAVDAALATAQPVKPAGLRRLPVRGR
jgi:EAL domain-containing protein (putative c-di-GMP-specific phosphodiesterase class I)